MKIAITAQGNDLDSLVDPRFGRAKYILIVDDQTREFEVIDNSENSNAFQGAGIQAASSVSDKGVDVLLTGHCGPKAFQVVDAAGIKVVNDVGGVVSEALDNFAKGDATYADTANVDGHW